MVFLIVFLIGFFGTTSDDSSKGTAQTDSIVIASVDRNIESLSNASEIAFAEEDIVSALSSVDGVLAVQPVTEARDPNHLLGQENGYISAVYFTFNLVDQSKYPESYDTIEKRTDGGGCIELFSNTNNAITRSN